MDPIGFKIKFGKPVHGWMEIVLGSRKMTVSDASCDSLFGLVKCMRSFIAGSTQEIVYWYLEPEYEKWIFERSSEQNFFYLLDHTDRVVVTASNAEGVILCITEALEKCYKKSFHNKPSTETHWSWDFPSMALLALKDELKERSIN